MKNVTPSPGQVWEHKKTNMSCILNEVSIDYADPVSLHKHFTFQTQTDLEWLAVNVNGVDVRSFYAKDTSSRDGYKVNGKDLIRNYGGKLVQSKQIELGLDEPQQKETTMIDLSGAKVGDAYEDEKGNVFEVTANGPINVVVKSPHDGGFFIVNHDGSFFGLTSLQLVTKHDNRHWLKDLPDADLFKLYQTSDIECNEFGVWVANSLGAHTLTLSGNKMPKLTGDEYKLSKISIPDLKAWQEKIK